MSCTCCDPYAKNQLDKNCFLKRCQNNIASLCFDFYFIFLFFLVHFDWKKACVGRYVLCTRNCSRVILYLLMQWFERHCELNTTDKQNAIRYIVWTVKETPISKILPRWIISNNLSFTNTARGWSFPRWLNNFSLPKTIFI